MVEKINEKVSVITVYNREKKTVRPLKVRWHGREYEITKTGYIWKEWEGRTRIHCFAVSTSAMAFKLRLNTETLEWLLVEVSDGFAA